MKKARSLWLRAFFLPKHQKELVLKALMLKAGLQKLSTTKGQYSVVGALLIVVLVAAFYNGKLLAVPEIIIAPEDAVSTVALSEDGPALPESLPVRLIIPKLNIDTGFEEPLGLLEDGTAEVPESNTEVGWYKYGPTPGEMGPAVIFGHVDSYIGPAIFFSLGQLKAGDEIKVGREDGSEARFVVTKLERYPQSNFPSAMVYGDIDHAGLRLITCSGVYDRSRGEYTHNLVVYARLAQQ